MLPRSAYEPGHWNFGVTDIQWRKRMRSSTNCTILARSISLQEHRVSDPKVFATPGLCRLRRDCGSQTVSLFLHQVI